MAWETRGGRRYYYRKVWKDGRCFSVYEGGGLAGRLAPPFVLLGREPARRVRLALRASLAESDALDAAIDSQWAQITAAVAAELEAAGFYRHKRQWRRRGNATR